MWDGRNGLKVDLGRSREQRNNTNTGPKGKLKNCKPIQLIKCSVKAKQAHP